MAKLKIKPFEVEGDQASIAIRWKKWCELLNDNFAWFEVEASERRLQALRLYGGDRIRELIDSLPDPVGIEDGYKRIMTKLDDFFLPKKNTDILVARFRSMRQKESESMNEYYARLRKGTKECEFHDADLEIKRHLQETILDRKLAKKSLKDKYTLVKLLEEAQAEEESKRYVREIAANPVNTQSEQQQHVVDQISRGYSRKYSTQRPAEKSQRTQRRSNSELFNCRSCGREHGVRECPAYGLSCHSCGKPNHFATMCRNAPFKGQARQSQVKVVQDEPSSSDEEYVQKVSIKPISYRKKEDNNNKETRVKLVLNGVKVKMAVDSGASVNVIDEARFCKIQERSKKKINLERSRIKLYGFGCTKPIPVAGKFCSTIENAEKIVPATFVVVKGKIDGDMLLGCDTAMELEVLKIKVNDIKVNPQETNGQKEQEARVNQIVSEFETLFHGIGKHKTAQVRIRVDESIQPVADVHRRIPYHYREKVERELEKLEQAGVIEPVPEGEPTTWISALVVQPKKQPGEIIICVDMRNPNKAMKREKREFPTVEEIIQDLNGATTFSKLDLNHGYHQLELHPDSRHLTTFNTPWGLKRYTRLNFGTVVAQEVFQEEIEKTIAGISGARNISDDIIIFGKRETEHNQALQDTLKRLKDNNLTLNKKKCLFNQQEIEFFGYIFSSKGLSPDPEKIQALEQAAEPHSAAEVRSFLGMANYSARFIRNFSALAAPLRELTRKDGKWRWEEMEQDAFRQLTSALRKATVMAYYEVGREIEVVVDASPHGLGAIVTQEHDAQFRPVMYVSRSLTEVEQRYSQTEREALAIRWACERVRMYLSGSRFKVITDHKPLTYIFNNSSSSPPIRIERWCMYLQEFDFTVEYRPGSSNPADYISRHPMSHNLGDSKEEKETERMINHIVTGNTPEAMTLCEIKIATGQDPTLKKIIESIQDGKIEGLDGEECKPFRRLFHELSVADGVVLRQSRIVIPKALQKKVLQLSHEGHQGIVKTKYVLRSAVWFPSMDTLAEREVRDCLACQASTPYEQREPLLMTELPEKPWQKISVDFSGPYPTGEYCLLMMDDFSRYPIVEIISTTSAAVVIPRLEKTFSLFGIPEECKSDNGPPFQGEEFRKFAESQGFKHRKITPLHPKANGEIERFVETVQKFIKTTTAEGNNWKATLPTFLRMYRSASHSVTGKSPYSLMFGGREMRGKIPNAMDNQSEECNVRITDAKAKERMKEYADRKSNVKPCVIEKGNAVLVRQRKQNKLTTPFESVPYVVSERKGSMITAERTTDGREVTRNSSHFKPVNIPNNPHVTRWDDNPPTTEVEENEYQDEITTTQARPENEKTDENREGTQDDEPSVRHSTREKRIPGYLKDYECG